MTEIYKTRCVYYDETNDMGAIISSCNRYNKFDYCPCDNCHDYVDKYQELAPVVHAKITISDDGYARCSACNKTIRYPIVSFSDIEYCPRCGAKIDNEGYKLFYDINNERG